MSNQKSTEIKSNSMKEFLAKAKDSITIIDNPGGFYQIHARVPPVWYKTKPAGVNNNDWKTPGLMTEKVMKKFHQHKITLAPERITQEEQKCEHLKKKKICNSGCYINQISETHEHMEMDRKEREKDGEPGVEYAHCAWHWNGRHNGSIILLRDDDGNATEWLININGCSDTKRKGQTDHGGASGAVGTTRARRYVPPPMC